MYLTPDTLELRTILNERWALVFWFRTTKGRPSALLLHEHQILSAFFDTTVYSWTEVKELLLMVS